jgi:hypothetical protein
VDRTQPKRGNQVKPYQVKSVGGAKKAALASGSVLVALLADSLVALDQYLEFGQPSLACSVSQTYTKQGFGVCTMFFIAEESP